MAVGGGYEKVKKYNNCVLEFLGIDNIHVMRQSYNKLLSLIESGKCDGSAYLEKLASTGAFLQTKNEECFFFVFGNFLLCAE